MSHWSNGKIKQYLVATMASSGGFIIGVLIGWTSSIYTWSGSVLLFAAAASTIPTAHVMDMIGRRLTMLLLAIPITIGWLMLALSSSVVFDCLGRFLQGISMGALSAAVPLYVREISEQKYYETLFPIYFLMINCGIFVVYLTSMSVLAWNVTWLCTIYAILFVIGFMTMPDSPVYLIIKGKIPEATHSLKKLRSPGHDIDAEIASIREAHTRQQKMREAFNIEIQQARTLKPFIIMIIIITFQQFTGIFVIIFFSSYLFMEAHMVSMWPQTATTLVGLALTTGGGLSMCFIKRFKRRTVLLVSTSVIALCTLLLAFYFFLLASNAANSNDWLPMLSVCTFAVMYAMANAPVSWVAVNEIFHPDIRELIRLILITIEWAIAFLVTVTFSATAVGIGMGATFTIYTIFAVLCVIVIAVFLIETNGQTIEQIQAKYNKPAPMITTSPTTSTAPTK